jgi:hypothetical protein
VPWPPVDAVATIRGGWSEERFASDGTADGALGRTWGVASLRRWMTAGFRLGLAAGLERWAGQGRIGRVGISGLLSTRDDRLRIGADLDGWVGPGSAARLRLASTARTGIRPGSGWSLTTGGSLLSGGSPPFLWDGAGVGRVRAPLLRGHPLVREDRLGRDAFGRGLLFGTLARAWSRSFGPGRLAVELFADAAGVWDPLVGDGPRSYLDPGVELRATDGDRLLAVSLARGGDEWVLSARVEAQGLPWLRVP